MTIEQKAKAYDEALEKAKKMYNSAKELGFDVDVKNLETIFPELAESEDEKIRKELIDFINRLTVTPNNIDKYNTWVAWLEKQGKKKPVDKVEPKFKVGDWVVNKFGDVWHIDSFDKKNYQVSDGEGNYNYFSIVNQGEMRLWTIADAKDGDVLVYNNGTVEIILLFKKWMGGVGKGAYSYVHTFDNEILFNDWSDCGYATHLATKEQRDLLFEKMKEEGYEWDAENKEVRKIEKQGEQSIFNTPSKEIILAIWELGNDWKELTGGSISTAYGTQLDYIQNHWNESEYYLKAKQRS